MSIYHLLAFLAVAFYATLPSIVKRVMGGGVDNYLFMGASMALLSLFSFSVALVKGNGGVSFDSLWQNNNWFWLILFTVLNFIAFALMVMAVQKVMVFDYQLMVIVQPLIGALIAYVLFKEQLELKHLVGFALVATGLCIALYNKEVTSS